LYNKYVTSKIARNETVQRIFYVEALNISVTGGLCHVTQHSSPDVILCMTLTSRVMTVVLQVVTPSGS